MGEDIIVGKGVNTASFFPSPQNKGKEKRIVVLSEQPNKLVKKSETVVNFNFAHDFNLSGKLFY